MKILMICTEKLPVPPIRGGAIQTYISGSLPYLRKQHEITVLGITDPSLPEKETVDNIHYVRVPGTVLEIYKEGIIRYLQSNQFDLIHIFNRPRLVLPVRQVAPNSIITLSMHNDMFNPEKISLEEGNAVINEVSRITTVSNYISTEIKKRFPQAEGKLRTIYSGVDSNQFLPGHHSKMQKIRQALRGEHGLENKTVILFAGRLSNNKGVDRLIRALPELAAKYKDLALVIVGSNWFSQNHVTDYVAYVRALAQKLPIPVVTTGFVLPSEIQNWFAAADIFVCTSIWQEPLARVHYEAMAAGLPIITTARGGNPEVIIPGENGYIVEQPEDPSEFTEKLSLLLSNRTKMKKMGERGRELALSLYKWERVASDILSFWQEALSAPATVTPIEYVQEQVYEQKTQETIAAATAKKTARAKRRSGYVTSTEKVSAEKSAVGEKTAYATNKARNVHPTEKVSVQRPLEPVAAGAGKMNQSKRQLRKEKNRAMLLEMLRRSQEDTLKMLFR